MVYDRNVLNFALTFGLIFIYKSKKREHGIFGKCNYDTSE